MNQKLRKTTLFLTLLTFSVFFLSSCSANYRIKGRVILLPELNSIDGFMVELTEQTLPLGGTPVEKAKVRMITQLDEQDKPVENTVWQNETLTDETGLFEVSDSGKPTKELKVGIEISKDGYKTIYQTKAIQSNSEAKVFLIVLVPNTAD